MIDSFIRVLRTAGGGGVVLDSGTLAVEFVVDDPRGLGLGGVEAALGSLADGCRTLGQASNVAGEHGCGGPGIVEGRGIQVEISYVQIQAA